MLNDIDFDTSHTDGGTAALMRPVCFAGCFGWLHTSQDRAASGTAVVLCSGIKNDAMTAHRSFRLLADALAAAGYPTLRFDYPGTGDSSDLDQASVEHWALWQNSINNAVECARRYTGAHQIVLGGFRLGATLAAVVAAQRNDVVGALLLAPVLRGRSYISQISIEANLHDPSAQVDGAVVLHEVHLPRQTVDVIRQIDLRAVVLPPRCKVAIFAESATPLLTECVDAWSKRGADVTCTHFVGLEPMLRPVFMNHEASADVSRIANWLRATLPPAEGFALQERLPPQAELQLETCVETPVRFGTHGRLFGVLCRPRGLPEADLVVVIGNSSADPHCGFARVAVDLARRLAAEGFASLRMDFAGIGDSIDKDDAPSHVFETDRRRDFSAAIDALAERGYRRFALQGLCSGAYHAFQAAVVDPRVGVLLLVNLPLFEWQVGLPVEYLSHVVESPGHFLQKIGRADLWVQLVRGQLDMANRLSTQRVWFVNKAKTLAAQIGARLGIQPRASFGQNSARTLSHRARTLFLFGEGDAGIASLAQEFGANNAPAGATLRVVPGLDHSLTTKAMQATAAEYLIAFLKQERLSYMSEEVSTAYEAAE